MTYLVNAFSLNMLDTTATSSLLVKPLTKEEASRLAVGAISYIGHESTSVIVGKELDLELSFNGGAVRCEGLELRSNRGTLALRPGDVLLVAQYVGPRLQEGATSLPEGARINYLKVTYS
jgi:hypothetical protein